MTSFSRDDRDMFNTANQAHEMENWFRKDAVEVHKVYGDECFWSVDKSRFLPGQKPPSEELKQMLVLYQGPFDVTTSSTSSQIDVCNCSWDEVLAQLAQAKTEDHDKDKWKSRKIGNFIASAAPYAKEWIEMMPDEYGLKVLKGGLALVFSTIRQRSENRAKIINAFEDLPDTIRTIDAACKIFSANEEENTPKLAKAFYDQLFRDIPQLIKILLRKDQKFKRVLNTLALGIPDSHKIDEILDRVRQTTAKMKSSVDRIEMKLLAKSNEDLEVIRSGVGALHYGMQQLPSKNDMVRLGYQLRNWIGESTREAFHSEIQKVIEQQSSLDLAAEVKTFVFNLVRENNSLRESNMQLQSQNLLGVSSRQPSPAPIPLVTRYDLLGVLKVEHRTISSQLMFVLQQAGLFDLPTQSRARWLLKTAPFQNWMASPQSCLLLVDGAMEGLAKVSPISVLVGTIATSLFGLNNAVTLHFFCGQNLEPDTDAEWLQGPNQMLRHLIVQLLLWFPAPMPDLSAIDSPQFLRDLYHCDLSALCEVFQILFRQLPPSHTLFCLIDGVSWYEREPWLRDLRFLVSMFQFMVGAATSSPAIKILMTSPNRSTAISGDVNRDSQYVSLHTGNMEYMPLASSSVVAYMSRGANTSP